MTESIFMMNSGERGISDLVGGGGGGGIYSICPYMERIIQTVGVVKSLYIVAGAAAAGSQ